MNDLAEMIATIIVVIIFVIIFVYIIFDVIRVAFQSDSPVETKCKNEWIVTCGDNGGIIEGKERTTETTVKRICPVCDMDGTIWVPVWREDVEGWGDERCICPLCLGQGALTADEWNDRILVLREIERDKTDGQNDA